jgi:formylglycine-generating enzyme required for sulfatase activity
MMGTSSQTKLPAYVLDERPEHEVILTSGFWIARYPICEADYQLIMGSSSPYFDRFGKPDLSVPACGVSWNSARKFCAIVTGMLHRNGFLKNQECIDLPTEAQWEYACRAGTKDHLWHFGDDIAMLDDYAWHRKNSGERLHPVGKKMPNQWGIHDLYGNVYEWALDDFGDYGTGTTERVDPYGTPFPWVDKGKVIRGGSCDTQGFLCRTAHRSWSDVKNHDGNLTGIRVVCTASTVNGIQDVLSI